MITDAHLGMSLLASLSNLGKMGQTESWRESARALEDRVDPIAFPVVMHAAAIVYGSVD